ncbi:ABC transporter ATP-binding protein [Paenibacillus sp. YN15]|uniref:ABC transporter ATP-binding protein n=1 Tax=Paenibacillus sp. YN15 TaxID=1742774 RepID=UPI000DCC7702|nr:ABC transporter ATP-binding protein [Paenibacillus sp. YN15]RAU99797.1 bacitracin ABC transporter ATP-binding protein [Paenibacillus sp. YN15]
MSNSAAILELRNLTKRIGGKTIVDHLSFDIPQGVVFGLLGPNGAGKTTTIRMITGLISMTEGSVKIGGLDVNSRFEEAMKLMGGIVENPEMYKYLTGYQNLIHFSRMHEGISKDRLQEVIDLVGLGNRIHDKVKRYSLGMRQRLGVAQAIMHRPKLLILDEPTNGLDPAGIRELRDYLRRLAKDEGITVLVSSHLLSEMELMCDRVAVIQTGKLVDIQEMGDITRAEGAGHVRFEISLPAEGAAAVGRLYPEAKVLADTAGFEAILEREEIPVIIEHLVKEGFRIYGVKASGRSLEDKFLEMTGSGQIE